MSCGDEAGALYLPNLITDFLCGSVYIESIRVTTVLCAARGQVRLKYQVVVLTNHAALLRRGSSIALALSHASHKWSKILAINQEKHSVRNSLGRRYFLTAYRRSKPILQDDGSVNVPLQMYLRRILYILAYKIKNISLLKGRRRTT